MPTKKTFVILTIVFLGILFIFFLKLNKFTKGPVVETSEIFQGVSYKVVKEDSFEISTFAENLFSPTRIKITPDGKNLLVSQITGEVLAFNKTENGWSRQPYLSTKVETKFPGFPPDEAGLVGMVFSKDFDKNQKLFLLYTFKDRNGKIQNRISSVTLKKIAGKLKGINLKLIWQANTPGAGSHQITDGTPISIDGQSRILFLIGEGFNAKAAQDPSLHAGKIISIKEDGTDTKVHALGIRNGYVLASNPYDKDERILISDTGPDKYDRLIYTNPLFDGPLNFGWDGDQEDLAKTIPDPNFKNVSDMVILRLSETKTFTGLSFHPDGYVLATLFGKTGSKDNSPGKEILLGKLTNLDTQPKISFETIIKRVEEANGKLGNPIGMEVDRKTGDFFFADIFEGRIYQVKVKGGDMK